MDEKYEKVNLSLEHFMFWSLYQNSGFAIPVWGNIVKSLAFPGKTAWFAAITKIWVLLSVYLRNWLFLGKLYGSEPLPKSGFCDGGNTMNN